MNETKLEVTQSLSLQDPRLTEVENGHGSPNGWARDIAERADPDELWGNLSEKEAGVPELES